MSDRPAAAGRRHLWDDIPKKPKQTSQPAIDQTAENRHRQKAMAHIAKLVNEIFVSQQSDNSGRLQTATINQMLDNKTTGPQRDDYSDSPLQKKSAVTKAFHNGPKTSLDIEELQTIAAMAKRLTANEKSHIT